MYLEDIRTVVVRWLDYVDRNGGGGGPTVRMAEEFLNTKWPPKRLGNIKLIEIDILYLVLVLDTW